MESDVKFPIIIKKKVPYISELLFMILAFCGILLALSFFLVLPSLRFSRYFAPPDVPEYVKWLILYTGVGFALIYILYKRVGIYKNGLLVFNSDAIVVLTNDKVYQIPIITISKVEFVDPTNSSDLPKGIFFIVIYQRSLESIQFRLKEYSDSDKIVDNFILYKGLKDKITSLERKFLSEENI